MEEVHNKKLSCNAYDRFAVEIQKDEAGAKPPKELTTLCPAFKNTNITTA
ncbi:MAG: hypothetical protein LBQ00_00955 [Syntrophobacterales bacterium]|jgi:hypothetical protein|nr:hypothetical protein [Syntrophobacterales bacterium]